ncbi:MAG: short-chain dehydrogenase/reductase [Fibrobacteria bacterium]|jgi:NAD(P)-dependent dehydrogenase (short-subunit alcohol dehydrogenase family)|nr:short-chain dehydrogenase/reductase [Fibrobacteria bacterium]
MTSASNAKPVALITGGTTGIGLATAKRLHALGYALVVTGQNPVTLEAARKELPGDVVVLRADLRSLTDADRVAAELKHRFEKLDFAFLNAGIVHFRPIEAVDEESFDAQFDVNVKGQYFTLQKILPLMGRGSSVVFCGSTIAYVGLPNQGPYTGTKGALLAMVRSLAVELAPRGIRVNSMSPGPVDTPALHKIGLPPEGLDALRGEISKIVPMGRFGTDEEIAGAVAFLASRDAGFITGTDLAVDGGMTAA